MQAAHHSVSAHTLVILHKGRNLSLSLANSFTKVSVGEALKKIASLVSKYFGLYYIDSLYLALDKIHSANLAKNSLQAATTSL